MKHISFIKRNWLLPAIALMILTTGCIKEDLDACSRLTLKVVNQGNEDITPGNSVQDATLYVFDENKTLLETRQLDAEFVKNRKEIVLKYPEGSKLTLVAYGNLGGGNQTVKTGTKADDLLVSLKTNDSGQASSPDSLFYGNKTVETIGYSGYVGGNQEIVIGPCTGTVTMETVNLSKAKNGSLKAGENDVYMFQVDRTKQSLDYNGEHAGDEVYYNPDGKFDTKQEWVTRNRTNMYAEEKLQGAIYKNGELLRRVEYAENQDGEEVPITVIPQNNTVIQLKWADDGTFIGAKIKITPWGVVDDNIDF